jgi:hypothetical protein
MVDDAIEICRYAIEYRVIDLTGVITTAVPTAATSLNVDNSLNSIGRFSTFNPWSRAICCNVYHMPITCHPYNYYDTRCRLAIMMSI